MEPAWYRRLADRIIPGNVPSQTRQSMKTSVILAAILLAFPAMSSAGHRPRVFISSHCQPGPYFGRAPYYPYYPAYGYYAPGPVLSFSYVSRPRVYNAPRYYTRSVSSLEADVQRALRRLGYYDGPVDGDIGPRSREAIRDYQDDHGLAITGRVDGSLLRSLGV